MYLLCLPHDVIEFDYVKCQLFYCSARKKLLFWYSVVPYNLGLVRCFSCFRGFFLRIAAAAYLVGTYTIL